MPLILGKEMNLSAINIMFLHSRDGFAVGLSSLLAVPAAAALTEILIDGLLFKPRQLDHEAIEAEAQRIIANQTKIKS